MPVELSAVCGETGLVWPSLPSWEDWAELGPRIASVNNVSRWALADWLCMGEDRFPDKAEQIVSQLGIAYHTIENLRWVGRRVPPFVRQPLPVTFSHHALVARLEPPAQDRLLTRCREKRWTREEFRAYLVGEGLIGDSPREDWHREAETALHRVLSGWYEQSDFIQMVGLPTWHREQEVLMAELLKLIERFRR